MRYLNAPNTSLRMEAGDGSLIGSLMLLHTELATPFWMRSASHYSLDPSTMSNLKSALRRRPLRAAWYSGELYQRLAWSTVANSITMIRFGGESPSRTSTPPPRTIYLPPYCGTLGEPARRYSS